MKKSKATISAFGILLLSSCSCLSSQEVHAQNTSGNFNFSLSASGQTSAGVFASDGTLIKTLWSNTKYTAGSHSGNWDGTDNLGRLMPNATYEVRVLTSQMKYTWEGVIGNTSDPISGPTVWHGLGNIAGLAAGGTNMYVPYGYNEGDPSMYKFNVSNPQKRAKLGVVFAEYYVVASDGNYVYWGGDDPNDYTKVSDWNNVSNAHFVRATKVSDDSEVVFANATELKPKISCIDLITKNANGTVSGLAVQKTGSYLFVSHVNLNELHVVDKKTGTLVRTIPVTAPKGLATDTQNNLWMIDDNGGSARVEKYTVNADGTLALIASITTLKTPLAIAVSPDDKTVLIADGGTSSQLKAFSNAASPASLWTYGVAGGYANSIDVADNKFDFRAQRWLNEGGQQARMYNRPADAKTPADV